MNFLAPSLHPLHPCLRALGPALSTLRVLSRPPHRPSSLGTYRKVHLRLWDLGTHGTGRASSRLPPGRVGHTRGRRQRWCRRNRCSPQWTHRSKCHKCRRRGMARGPPTKRTSRGLNLNLGRELWLMVRVQEMGWGAPAPRKCRT